MNNMFRSSPAGGHGNGTGPFPSFLLLEILRETQFRGEFIQFAEFSSLRVWQLNVVMTFNGSHIVLEAFEIHSGSVEDMGQKVNLLVIITGAQFIS